MLSSKLRNVSTKKVVLSVQYNISGSMCTVAKCVKVFDALDVKTPLEEKNYFKGRNFREFLEFGVFSQKFDPAKCNSRGCSQRFILSKVSSHKNLFSLFL